MLLVDIYDTLQNDHNSMIDQREKSKMTCSHKYLLSLIILPFTNWTSNITSTLLIIILTCATLCTRWYVVAGSISLTMADYDAFESDGEVSVCAVLNAEALERRIIVQLSSQDSTAQSKIFKVYTFCVSVQYTMSST